MSALSFFPVRHVLRSAAVLLAVALSGQAGAQTPAGGSHWSRATGPAERQLESRRENAAGVATVAAPKSVEAEAADPSPAPRSAISPGTPAGVAMTPEPVLAPTGRPTTPALAPALEAAGVAPAIRAQTFPTREPMLNDLEARIVASEAAVAKLSAAANDLSAEGRAQLLGVTSELGERVRTLQQSLALARKSAEHDWDRARARLAADYEAYAAAVARVDRVAQTAAAPR